MLTISLLLIGCIDKEEEKDDTEETEEEASEFAEIGPMNGMVNAHNEIRQEHGIQQDLIWDEYLAEEAKIWIEYLDQDLNCQMEHNWDSPLGENLFWASYMTTATEVVQAWASEEQYYDYDSNSCQAGEMCGHYTQIVWEDTERVGCAMMECSNGSGFIWMCNYDPAGNWQGEKPY